MYGTLKFRDAEVLTARGNRAQEATKTLEATNIIGLGSIVCGYLNQGIGLLQMLAEQKRSLCDGLDALVAEQRPNTEPSELTMAMLNQLQMAIDAIGELESQIQTNGQGLNL